MPTVSINDSLFIQAINQSRRFLEIELRREIDIDSQEKTTATRRAAAAYRRFARR